MERKLEKKQDKYFKGKADCKQSLFFLRSTILKKTNDCSQSKEKIVIFTVPSLKLYQYPSDLPPFLEIYLKSSKYLKMGKFELILALFAKAIFSGCGPFIIKSKEMRINEHSFLLVFPLHRE